jgi:chromosome partitioning protein
MRRVIFNQKGGVGKTTITCNLAAMSAVDGHKTLVIDMDPQCNATQYLLGDKANQTTGSLLDFYNEMLNFSFRKKGLAHCVMATPFRGLDLIPAHPDLYDLQAKLESRYKIYKLRDALDSLAEYDYIFIDTPPALNFFSRSALIAADTCLIPFDCDDFSRHALYTLLNNVTEIQQDHNAELVVEGIVVNQYQSRARLPQKMVTDLQSEGLPVLPEYLSASVVIRESHERAMPMVYLDPKHKLSLEFEALYRKLNGKPSAA